MATSMSGSTTFTDPAGYQVTCTTGPVPIASGGQTLPQIDDTGCRRIAEDFARTYLAGHPGAKVDSVTVEGDAVTNVCYSLAGQSKCETVPR